MKKLLLIAFLFGFGAIQAQDILITNANGDTLNGDTVLFEKYMSASDANNPNFYLQYQKAFIKNKSIFTIDVEVIRILGTTQPNINDRLCWGTLCENEVFPIETVRHSLTTLEMEPNDEISGPTGLIAYYLPLGSYGVSYFKYTFVDVNNQVNPASFVVKFNATQTVGIEENAAFSNFSISPNPANEFFELKHLPKNANSTVEILNIVGKVVSEKAISNHKESERIEISHLRPGIYFVRIQSNNQYSATQKLIVR